MASKLIAESQEVLEFLTAVIRGEEEEITVIPSGKKIKAPPKISDRLKAAEHLLKIYNAKTQPESDAAQLLITTLQRVADLK